MGTFSVPIQADDPAGEHFRSIDALVDTGASYTTIPASVLREPGVTPHARRAFTLATGATVMKDIGRAWVRIDGQSEMTIVVFGDEDALSLLGAVTLEEFGLGVDLLNKKLVPVPGLLT